MSTSYHVINLVREKISNEYVRASDTAVAKALGISRAAVSAYKSGRDNMSLETLQAANRILKLEVAELSELAISLIAEALPYDPKGQTGTYRFYDMVRGELQRLALMAKDKAASILLASMIALSPAGSGSSAQAEVTPDIHYAK